MIYGEIMYRTLAWVFKWIQKTQDFKGKVFVDLGSGAGKSVLIAGLINRQFEKVVGIEIVQKLYDKSIELKQRY